ncbi:MAG: UDP-N-acetylmuramoyl-tripeptide--D-alanyl-D-alanine ligase [Gemmatimonadetes bacterium]|nr:MAG: UDP-N-acetylmuramoyl-tripeptide--D-alanyl-D-alanine ligase [Gemmatimonadota bacterium]
MKDEFRELLKRINQVTIDSRQVQPGDLFIAIRGEQFDGHDFIPQALAAGAKAVLVDQTWANQHTTPEVPRIIVEDTRRSLQDLARLHREQFNIPVIAITGSNGKTTTKDLIAAVLSQQYRVLKNEGNLNNHFGVPLTLLKLRPTHEIAVIEMGMNHFGELAELCTIAQPTVGIITNVGTAHIEFFGTKERIAEAKSEVIQALKPEHLALLNSDDPEVMGKIGKTKAKIITFGITTRADVRVVEYQLKPEKSTFRVEYRSKGLSPLCASFEINQGGLHMIYNALVAAAVGLQFGLSPEHIQAGFSQFQPAKMRFQPEHAGGLNFINDAYNANPDSMRVSLAMLHITPVRGKRIAVLGDMLELGDAAPRFHYEVGEQVAQLKIDRLVGVGALARQIAQGALAAGIPSQHVFCVGTATEAAKILVDIATPEDLILLKASRSMALERILSEIEHPS